MGWVSRVQNQKFQVNLTTSFLPERRLLSLGLDGSAIKLVICPIARFDFALGTQWLTATSSGMPRRKLDEASIGLEIAG